MLTELRTRLQSSQDQLVKMQKELDESNKKILYLTNGSEKLSHMLGVGQTSTDKSGLEYIDKSSISQKGILQYNPFGFHKKLKLDIGECSKPHPQ
ncbi:hypothetical protein TorRG33x02_226160, partial [Trema orientale]